MSRSEAPNPSLSVRPEGLVTRNLHHFFSRELSSGEYLDRMALDASLVYLTFFMQLTDLPPIVGITAATVFALDGIRNLENLAMAKA